ncbi:hypothetical protein [Actinokineospora iranica]|uniref:Uncharacterized protein n=1 Tax=Actinokineospora iranica TaxID=1271860 RepID=A0A1G6SZN3_9PSEU|nr:hypothetical protein [Actinokineospora iranica]SDD21555.1 hypothetical protein SAMN05216174_108239 [Actinokineospora iranica]
MNRLRFGVAAALAAGAVLACDASAARADLPEAGCLKTIGQEGNPPNVEVDATVCDEMDDYEGPGRIFVADSGITWVCRHVEFSHFTHEGTTIYYAEGEGCSPSETD